MKSHNFTISDLKDIHPQLTLYLSNSSWIFWVNLGPISKECFCKFVFKYGFLFFCLFVCTNFKLICSNIITSWNCKENVYFLKPSEQHLRQGLQIHRIYFACINFLMLFFRGKSTYMGLKGWRPLKLRKNTHMQTHTHAHTHMHTQKPTIQEQKMIIFVMNYIYVAKM